MLIVSASPNPLRNSEALSGKKFLYSSTPGGWQERALGASPAELFLLLQILSSVKVGKSPLVLRPCRLLTPPTTKSLELLTNGSVVHL